jgi:GcrA cell cycle regulator
MPAGPGKQWCNDRITQLKKLLIEGASYGYIANVLHTTRSAIAGKVNRLGLAVTRPKADTLENPEQLRIKPRRPSYAVRKPHVDVPPMHPEKLMHIRDVDVPLEQRKTLFELAESECRWPLGDPQSPDFRYCGGLKVVGPHPYCAPHMRIARPGWRG